MMREPSNEPKPSANRSRQLGIASLQMAEVAKVSIEESRKLLDELACQIAGRKAGGE